MAIGLLYAIFKSASSGSSDLLPETIDYRNRLLADNETISDEDLQLVNGFLAGLCEDGLRDPNNPQSSILREFSFYGGNSLNSALHKLFYIAGTPAKCTNVNFVEADFSRTTGLAPDISLSKSLSTGLPSNLLSYENTHLSSWTNSERLSNNYEHLIGAFAFNLELGWSFDRTTYYSGKDFYALSEPINRIGLFTFTRTPSAVTFYHNGVPFSSLPSIGEFSFSDSAINVFRGHSLNSSQAGIQYSIGTGMTDAQSLAFYNRCLTLQQGLGRLPINPEVLEYRARILAQGGTISASTLASVDKLTTDLQSVKSKIIALYPVAGDRLQDALVPLYTTVAATGYNYVAGDYVERGMSGGLKGGNGKYVNTGITGAGLSPADFGLGFYFSEWEYPGSNYEMLGGWLDTSSGVVQVSLSRNGGLIYPLGGNSYLYNTFSDATKRGFIFETALTASSLNVYINGNFVSGSAYDRGTDWNTTRPLYLGARNLIGNPDSFSAARIKTAVLTKGLSEAEALILYNAVYAFNSALGRAEASLHADTIDFQNRMTAASVALSEDDLALGADPLIRALQPFKANVVGAFPIIGVGLNAAKLSLFAQSDRLDSSGGLTGANKDLLLTNVVAGDYAQSKGLKQSASSILEMNWSLQSIDQANFTALIYCAPIRYNVGDQCLFGGYRNFIYEMSFGAAAISSGLIVSGGKTSSPNSFATGSTNFSQGMVALTASSSNDLRLYTNTSLAGSTSVTRDVSGSINLNFPLLSYAIYDGDNYGRMVGSELRFALLLNRGVSEAEIATMYTAIQSFNEYFERAIV
jgi:hypothetical protein